MQEKTTVEPTYSLNCLLPGAGFLPVECFRELTTEEAALRHQLELRGRAGALSRSSGVNSVGRLQILSPSLAGVRIWGDKQKVEEASIDAKIALGSCRLASCIVPP